MSRKTRHEYNAKCGVIAFSLCHLPMEYSQVNWLARVCHGRGKNIITNVRKKSSKKSYSNASMQIYKNLHWKLESRISRFHSLDIFIADSAFGGVGISEKNLNIVTFMSFVIPTTFQQKQKALRQCTIFAFPVHT
ncbi:unnamed protein product [Nesidiocoris tenuis]|uniref:Uncharacterized protein n=1 Tax=Nesidiocoris tenuis TaxID=355587 RepID=A0A6H5HNN2_9HEMI|nr:unnamed protein product [Nesidiocoris tenuis]